MQVFLAERGILAHNFRSTASSALNPGILSPASMIRTTVAASSTTVLP
jgi:hypothetical protein